MLRCFRSDSKDDIGVDRLFNLPAQNKAMIAMCVLISALVLFVITIAAVSLAVSPSCLGGCSLISTGCLASLVAAGSLILVLAVAIGSVLARMRKTQHKEESKIEKLFRKVDKELKTLQVKCDEMLFSNVSNDLLAEVQSLILQASELNLISDSGDLCMKMRILDYKLQQLFGYIKDDDISTVCSRDLLQGVYTSMGRVFSIVSCLIEEVQRSNNDLNSLNKSVMNVREKLNSLQETQHGDVNTCMKVLDNIEEALVSRSDEKCIVMVLEQEAARLKDIVLEKRLGSSEQEWREIKLEAIGMFLIIAGLKRHLEFFDI